ncbi:MAG: tRNA (N6-isopentenyl adenosine(37)-C2)-methylthiotransferase MiaB [Desulfovibrio sp.]|uniref:tRNA (N6-isopentenyl adenosine(37)-C2)-methylthiotransferase MiaB n=1 Tax=Desulfovibrio sp. TaxID=885 RepID=UPI001A6B777A|nr:tRNA (N6-isopentenyl adenosine(37)-C2)-methylthiotransferase MiaB [Desulfovibrio sp.]MBD5416246.1 tRNA (N6-isopentenyl adenosine(37)-C2)-methylthiotransferase MiaB [Desulfovibrio sp.]
MQPRSYHILTFGCQMNVHDSGWLGAALEARGFVPAALEDAEVVVINTCSVREKPEQKVMSALGRVRQATGGDGRVLVAVAGCVAQQLGAELFDRSPQVRLVAGSDGITDAPGAIERLLTEPEARLTLCAFTETFSEKEAAPRRSAGPSALLTIMQGCDNFCAYCIVPFTRGRQKSRNAGAILEECRQRIAEGAREITLLGQNVNAYGQDKTGDGTSFSRLLEQVATLPGLARLRYVTPHPKDMGPEDVAAFGSLPALCPRLHLPLQAGSDAVLARMRRRYDSAGFLRLVEDLRAARPDIALSTDLIVGFPGETESDFQATLDMMEACGFMSSFSFCYSDRPGAAAARFPDKVAPEVQHERLLRLQALQDRLGQRWLDARVGQATTLLIEGKSPRQEATPADAPGCARAVPHEDWQGRDPYGVPVHVALPEGSDHTGRLVAVDIVAAKRHSLVGRPVPASR